MKTLKSSLATDDLWSCWSDSLVCGATRHCFELIICRRGLRDLSAMKMFKYMITVSGGNDVSDNENMRVRSYF